MVFEYRYITIDIHLSRLLELRLSEFSDICAVAILKNCPRRTRLEAGSSQLHEMHSQGGSQGGKATVNVENSTTVHKATIWNRLRSAMARKGAPRMSIGLEVAFKKAWQAWSLKSIRTTGISPRDDRCSDGECTEYRLRPERSTIQRLPPAYIPKSSVYSEHHDPKMAPNSSAVTLRQFADDSDLSRSSSGSSLKSLEGPSESHTSKRWKSVVTRVTPATSSTSSVNGEPAEEEFSSSPGTSQSFRYELTEAHDLAVLTAAHPIPPQTGTRWWSECRYRWMSTYRKLWALVILTNVAVIVTMTSSERLTYESAATATGANLMVAALTRHDHFINLLFRLACALPNGTPLCIRRQAAKVFSYGGVHSGCGVSAFLWYIVFTVLMVRQIEGTDAEVTALAVVTAATLFLLTLIISMSHPYIRTRWHNQWELSHRYGGYTAIVLVWAQTLLVLITQAHHSHHSIARTLLTTPTLYFLILVTLIIIYPWLRLRRRNITAQKLSTHATRLHFDDKKLPSCMGYRLSHAPWRENHGFATIPNPDNEKGYSIVVSNAGDFTKNLINDPPTHIWTRGAPVAGVTRVATLFRRIVVVATGSGIGPWLSFLNVYGADYPLRIIWSARSPQETYGEGIMRAVLRADKRAIVIDTKKTGHPDLPALTYAVYADIGAEAVVVISNPTVTGKLVFEMESRGVPAFGPVFDS